MILQRFRRKAPKSNVLRFSESFDLPPGEVFRLLRDHLEEIGPHIPEISTVTCVQRLEDGTRTSMLNEWRAEAATIPRSPARSSHASC